jgi:hypothetical protein
MANRNSKETRLREGFPHSDFDSSVATYLGSGGLSVHGRGTVQCRFRADQDADGSIQIVFSGISALDFVNHLPSVVKSEITADFRGTTDDGIPITAKCTGGRTLSLDAAGNATIYFAPRALTAYPEITLNTECRLLITNFAFPPFTQLGEPPHHPPPHVFSLDIAPETVEIEIKPLDDYVQRIVHIQQTRTVLPTASLTIRTKAAMAVTWYHELASRLCNLISVAAGTAVQWIAADGFDAEIKKHYRFHSARVTKPFCSLPTIPIKELSYQVGTRVLTEFLQKGLNRLRETDERQVANLIAAFLDARLEGEFLETRAIKIAVTLEILKNGFVDRFMSERWDSMMPSAVRKKLVRVASTALKAEGFNTEVIKTATEALNQLSRPPLRMLIEYMVDTLPVALDRATVKRAVAIRNRLIHAGRFLSDTSRDKARELKIADAFQEFYILVSFVDRLMLGILGHSGPYNDYSTSEDLRIKTVITGFRAGKY